MGARSLASALRQPCIRAGVKAASKLSVCSPIPTPPADYHGFPKKAYDITYPAAGDPQLAMRILELLRWTVPSIYAEMITNLH